MSSDWQAAEFATRAQRLSGGVRASGPVDAGRRGALWAARHAGDDKRRPHGELTRVGRKGLPVLPVVLQVTVSLLVRIRDDNAPQDQGSGGIRTERGAVSVDTVAVRDLVSQAARQALVIPTRAQRSREIRGVPILSGARPGQSDSGAPGPDVLRGGFAKST